MLLLYQYCKKEEFRMKQPDGPRTLQTNVSCGVLIHSRRTDMGRHYRLYFGGSPLTQISKIKQEMRKQEKEK